MELSIPFGEVCCRGKRKKRGIRIEKFRTKFRKCSLVGRQYSLVGFTLAKFDVTADQMDVWRRI